MKLLKTHKEWKKWIENFEQKDEPTTFPCYGYEKIVSFDYEETGASYLYPSDIEKMHKEISRT